MNTSTKLSVEFWSLHPFIVLTENDRLTNGKKGQS